MNRKLNEEEIKAIKKFEQDCSSNNVKTFRNVETDNGYGFLKDEETGEIIHTYKTDGKPQFLLLKQLQSLRKTNKKLMWISIALGFLSITSHIFIVYFIVKGSK